MENICLKVKDMYSSFVVLFCSSVGLKHWCLAYLINDGQQKKLNTVSTCKYILDRGPRYRKIPPAAVANQIAGKPRIPRAD